MSQIPWELLNSGSYPRNTCFHESSCASSFGWLWLVFCRSPCTPWNNPSLSELGILTSLSWSPADKQTFCTFSVLHELVFIFSRVQIFQLLCFYIVQLHVLTIQILVYSDELYVQSIIILISFFPCINAIFCLVNKANLWLDQYLKYHCWCNLLFLCKNLQISHILMII